MTEINFSDRWHSWALLTKLLRVGVVLATSIFLIGQDARAETVANANASFGRDPLRETLADSTDVDAFTGGLLLRYDDVTIPGNGGMDIVVKRAYSSNSVRALNTLRSVTESYLYSRSALGVGWSIMVAPRLVIQNYRGTYGFSRPNALERLCTNQLPGNYDNAYAMHLHLPDGQQMPLYGVAPGLARSKELWQATCTNWVVTVKDPNGTTYTLENATLDANGAPVPPLPGGDFTTGWNPNNFGYFSILVTKRKTDLNGNWLAYTYFPGTKITPSRIDSSDGRWVSFSYGDTLGLGLQQLTSIQTSSGGVWSYQYRTLSPSEGRFFALSRVTLPTGDSMQYDYHQGTFQWGVGDFANISRMKSRTEPAGGQVNYTYAYYGYNFTIGGPNWSETDTNRTFRVARVDVPGGSKTYSYVHGGLGQYDTTTVVDEAGTTVYRFIGSGYNWNGFSSARTNTLWKVGLLIEKQIGNQQSETYEYTPVEIAPYPTLVGGGIEPQSDEKAWKAVPSKATMVRNGQTYVAQRLNFDAYGNPGLVIENGPNGGSRSTTVTYVNDVAKWMIGKRQNESFTGGNTTRTFDANGNTLSVTRDGVTTSFSYDAQGNVATKTLPRGLTHYYANYRRGIAQLETQPEGIVIRRVVDEAGNVVSETDGEGNTTTYAFDGLNRPLSITHPLGAPKTFSYTYNSQVVTRADLVETTIYDGFRRPVSVTLGGIRRTYAYDSLGRRVFESDPGAATGRAYQYDILERLVRMTNADGSIQVTSYGPASRTVTDERGNALTYVYRSYGDPKQEFLVSISGSLPAANVTISRNARDLITSVSQGGFARLYAYNDSYYLSSIVNPETGTTTYGRDAAGNMTSRVVGGSGATSYTYDGQNRLTTTVYPGAATTNVTYNRVNKMLTSSSPAGSRAYSYDANGNLVGESLVADGVTLAVGYLYNSKDQLASISYPRSGIVVNYAPDALGRPTQASGFVTSVTYWPSGQLRDVTYANGTVSSYGQNVRLWPSSFQTRLGASVYLNTTYGYDGTGNLTSLSDTTDAAYSRTLGYDALNRLTVANGPWGAGSIVYDGTGNILSQSMGGFSLSYAYNASSGLLTGVSGSRAANYSYDAYGSMVSDGSRTHAYDGVPNLRCVNCNDTSTRVDYTYDALNRRISSLRAGSKTYEMYGSNGNLLAEFTPGPENRVVQYVYLGNKRVAQIEPSATSVSGPGPLALTTVAGRPSSFRVAVSGNAPTGTLTLYENGVSLGSAQVVAGVATVSLTLARPGMHTITIVYSGDAFNAGTSTTVSVMTLMPPEQLLPILQLLLED